MYEKIIKLGHDEIAAKVNISTGETTTLDKKPNNIPKGKERFSHDESFAKAYDRSWAFLANNLSGTELKIALLMAGMTEYSTNSLSPLDDKVSYEMLAETFGISKGVVKKAFKNLLDIGVYATFRYGHYRRGVVEEWVFNPFVSFKGKLIDSDLKNLFVNTRVAKHFLRDEFM